MSGSDTVRYYNEVANSRSGDIFDFFGIGTTFMFFAGYPFIKWLGMNYYDVMATFCWFGFLGAMFFFIAINNLLPSRRIKILRIDALYLVFLLPNMHFWTCYLGKDTLLFLGLGVVFWGMEKIGRRLIVIVLGLLLMFFIRPHIVFGVFVAIMLVILFMKSKITTAQRIGIGIFMIIAISLSIGKVFEYTKVDINDPIESFNATSLDRSQRLSSNSGSGVNLASYSLPVQIFTFLYRPLFIDSPNVLGYISSFENLLILYLTIKVLFSRRRLLVVRAHNFQIYFSAMFFIIGTLMLSSSLSNLGIIIREKNMVMIFLLLILLYALSTERKILDIRRAKLMQNL
ncbi:hypothetical protein [Mucilaginibacter sp. dw_454]|uniref:hypothetical protein n=1 Tax=Mucilaginibacter sp. dw_454 TaxID=2720079 RepID=UPI001BD2A684|nr:hypothetical protein [Mucilaginibacter sp. dw_454]